MTRRLAAYACAIALIAAACSDDGGDSAESPVGPTGTSETSETAATTVESTTTTEAMVTTEVSVATLNVLHGIFCPAETDQCGAPDRLSLLFGEIEAAGCPDLVGLQEIGPRQSELVPQRLESLCGGAYELLWDPVGQGQNLDQEMILSALSVIDDAYVELASFPWGGHWAQVATAEGGVVDFVTTHLASSANNPDCDTEICPPELCEVGLETGTCHARELLAFLETHADPAGLTILTGDLNKPIDDPRIVTFLDGGFVDAWLAAGQPECDPATGEGCTCCLEGEDDIPTFQDPDNAMDARIDFVLTRTPPDCTTTATADAFAAAPVAPINGFVWVSDHGGVAADLSLACPAA